MANYSVATTKDNLSSLIDKALAGEEVVITRHGKPTVRLHAIAGAPVRKLSPREAMENLRRVREARPTFDISSADLIRQMRDEGIG